MKFRNQYIAIILLLFHVSSSYSFRHRKIVNKLSNKQKYCTPVTALYGSFLHDTDFLVSGINFIDNLFQSSSHAIGQLADTIQSNPIPVTTTDIISEEVKTSGSLIPLGNDLLIFLCATICIVPLFKFLNASPVLGFLAAGLLLGPAGLHLFSDLGDLEELADFGVLFLLFEQGLELTIDRLKKLSKFAFGMGTLQVFLSTIAFFIFPFIGGVQFLEFIVGADPAVVDITRFDEALVIGAALSLSSSAFVLKILQEKNQLSTKFGAASLGILLLQDIAVVPVLVLLPIIESNTGTVTLEAQLTILGLTFLKALVGLGGILFIGGALVRYLFSIVAKSRSSETFVALCLLVALGTGGLTDALGLSSTLGAFVAGTLLAESNYRTQIETDIQPFRGLLLGLFFMTTGASVEPNVIQEQWPTVIALTGGLIAFKTVILTFLGPFFELTKAESIRTGLLLSGGGEFAFVVLTLADKLRVIPDQLAKILVGVVVISMALTPYLSQFGDIIANYLDNEDRKRVLKTELTDCIDKVVDEESTSDCIVICGYGVVGQNIVKFMNSELIKERLQPSNGKQYIAFDLDPALVISGYRSGVNILYGEGSQPLVLSTAGIENPKAFIVTYDDDEMNIKAVERLHESYPGVPIFARSTDMSEYYHILEAGATKAQSDDREVSLKLGGSLMTEVLGFTRVESDSLQEQLRFEMDQGDNAIMDARWKQKNSSSKKTESKRVQIINEENYSGSFESLRPMLNGVARQVAGIIDSSRILQVDNEYDSDPAAMDLISKMVKTISNGISGIRGDNSLQNISMTDNNNDNNIINNNINNNNDNNYNNNNNNNNSTVFQSPLIENKDKTKKEVNEIDSDLLGVTMCILPPKSVDEIQNVTSESSNVTIISN
eukprot:gene11716-15683_t